MSCSNLLIVKSIKSIHFMGASKSHYEVLYKSPSVDSSPQYASICGYWGFRLFAKPPDSRILFCHFTDTHMQPFLYVGDSFSLCLFNLSLSIDTVLVL